jgi:dephospho-CoA kinase
VSAPAHLLAVVGMAGAGKSTVSRIVATLGYERVYFGGFVVEEVARRGMPPGQASESTVREELRDAHGMGAIAVLAEPRLRELLAEGRSVVIDGLYSRAESLLLEQHFPLVHLAVHASTWTRMARMEGRAERPLTPAELDARDTREIELLDKAAPIATAQTHVVNDGTEDELRPVVVEAVARLQHYAADRWAGHER